MTAARRVRRTCGDGRLALMRLALVGAAAAAVTFSNVHDGDAAVARLAMTCSRGHSPQWYEAVVSAPESAVPGSTITIRIESRPSGRISHFGLHYIHGMKTEYRISPGAAYVEGSARIVPGTGTPNVARGARVWHDAAGIHTLLPGHVENGGSFTPPTVTFDLRVDAAPPAVVYVEFVHYEVMAHVLLLGEQRTTCDPQSRPAIVTATHVVAPAPH